MEEIFFDKSVDNEQILNTLSEVFPALTVFYWDFNNDAPEKFDSDNSDHIFFNTDGGLFNSQEFEFRISIYRTPKDHCEERELYLGKIFSDKYKIRTLIPFTKPDEPDDPYYDIVFDGGKIYLADDSEVDRMDDPNPGMVKILREYELPVHKFDESAVLIKS